MALLYNRFCFTPGRISGSGSRFIVDDGSIFSSCDCHAELSKGGDKPYMLFKSGE